ncbi:MAG: hypothetical protein ACE5JA_02350 [bacterium]
MQVKGLSSGIALVSVADVFEGVEDGILMAVIGRGYENPGWCETVAAYQRDSTGTPGGPECSLEFGDV